MFNNFCIVTDISATVTLIGVKFRVMIHISPGIVLSTLESGTPKMVQRGRIDSTWPVAALTARSEARYWFRIAISVYPTCIRVRGFPSDIAMSFDVERLEWCGYPAVKTC